MYKLLDSGDKFKLEAFGRYKIIRPCGMALWPRRDEKMWDEKNVDAIFTREQDEGWIKNKLPRSWDIEIKGIKARVKPTEFGHLGLFPEHLEHFDFFEKALGGEKEIRVLNLFAYSGATSAFLAKKGCHVTHVDASKPMILWAKENTEINGLEDDAVRWITDDAIKFVEREGRRGNVYDAILLDPPTFGRGDKGQVFKIEESLDRLVSGCLELLSDRPCFFLFTNHTPGFTPLFLNRYFSSFQGRHLKAGFKQSGEMLLGSKEEGFPMGAYYRWSATGE
ncbi:hypothetical protein COB21_04155 [Candidatus Aerophobetes bacterium]|uniref:S-adenosylmethionine-dependent methyltransferase domain-containing protein n=1 Tax=Aerophobetes bacterium TaxID=2030807 RepID=A0A2A4X3J4_UNCAE|nr:MAG: hypothetical protein COB21_04155 [Candidatus Aerophobetes bacterium]